MRAQLANNDVVDGIAAEDERAGISDRKAIDRDGGRTPVNIAPSDALADQDASERIAVGVADILGSVGMENISGKHLCKVLLQTYVGRPSMCQMASSSDDQPYSRIV